MSQPTPTANTLFQDQEADHMLHDKQAREVAAKFARDAIRLIERGKAPDVCARKLNAAAAVMSTHPASKTLGDELVAQRTMLGVAVRDLQLCQEQLQKCQVELDSVKAELEGMKAQLSVLGGRT